MAIKGRLLKMICPDDHRMGVESVLSGRDYPIGLLPKKFLPTTIVDVGANVGSAALYFHQYFPDARIYCYEPSAFNYRYLLQNTSLIPQITCFPMGLYNQDKEMPLYHHPTGGSGAFSIKYPATSGYEHELVQIRKASQEFKERNLTNISILKIDAEASEPEILHDLFSGLPECNVLFIYLEYHGNASHRFLTDLLAHEYEETTILDDGQQQGTLFYANKDFLKFLATQR